MNAVILKKIMTRPLPQDAEALLCQGLTAGYRQNGRQGGAPVLHGVSACIERGEFVCIAGPNGGGKSSLLALLSGIEGRAHDALRIQQAECEPEILFSEESNENRTARFESAQNNGVAKDDPSRNEHTDSGSLCYAAPDMRRSIPLSTLTRTECARLVAFMPQSEQSAWNASVLDTILTGRYAASGTSYTQADVRAAQQAAEELGICHLLERGVQGLSGGEFQKVRIARTLAQDAPFILLDEPCAALDISYEPVLLQKLRSIAHDSNKGILISIHNINLAARFADRLILLPPDSPAISGTPKQILTEQNLQKTYGTPLKIFTHPVYACPQVL